MRLPVSCGIGALKTNCLVPVHGLAAVTAASRGSGWEIPPAPVFDVAEGICESGARGGQGEARLRGRRDIPGAGI